MESSSLQQDEQHHTERNYPGDGYPERQTVY